MTPDNQIASKNALILSLCQALNGISAMTVITTGGILGYTFAENKSLATLPIAFFNLGAWLSSYPAAQIMQKYGRQAGFMLGASIGLLGALVCFYAILQKDFIFLTLGTTCLGSFQGFAQFYRFAATDMASDEYKPKAISKVMIGGIAAAVIGGPVITASKMSYEGVLFAGSFLILALVAVMVFLLIFLVNAPMPAPEKAVKLTRTRREIFSDPRLVVSILCGMITYALMSLVMTASPLAMMACNHGLDDATYVIQWHVLGMFAPSLVTGHLISRFGVRSIMTTGFAFMLLSAIIALTGISFWHFWLSLALLGIGWNFGFIGASTLVASASRPEERGIVQGTNDTLILGMVALASFLSGQVLETLGWEFINISVLPLCIFAMLALFWLGKKESKDQRSL